MLKRPPGRSPAGKLLGGLWRPCHNPALPGAAERMELGCVARERTLALRITAGPAVDLTRDGVLAGRDGRGTGRLTGAVTSVTWA